MTMAYAYRPFPYTPPPGLTGPEPRHKVAIVAAGPVGLALAIDLAQYGVASVVLDDNNVVSVGSRAICWSKRSLEILDRLGIGQKCVDKGVIWKVGRTLHREEEIWNFDLQPDPGHKMPALVNLQQYYVEQYLVTRATDFPDLIDLRWKNRVTGITQSDDVTLTIDTPDGAYPLKTDYLIACDGARSPSRALLDLDFDGELFEERFLIADIEMQVDLPPGTPLLVRSQFSPRPVGPSAQAARHHLRRPSRRPQRPVRARKPRLQRPPCPEPDKPHRRCRDIGRSPDPRPTMISSFHKYPRASP